MIDVDENSVESSIEATKLKDLCNLVLLRAKTEYDRIIDDAQSKIDIWNNEQEAKLDAERSEILMEANKQAEEIANNRVNDAKRENNRERMKLQSKCVETACAVFQSKLEALHERDNYKEILTGLALEAIEEAPQEQDISLRLSAADAGLGEEIVRIINEAIHVNLSFDPAPGEFKGGVMISSAGGHWSVTSDWHAIAEESMDTIAARIFASILERQEL